ncbi:hypothetical protein C3B51_09360 [Pseudoalteromonas rubra]|uniref:DegT/DnrJ/EryC1/StrS aminotransferase family protein n=1 Tax=Pseudoalteromonas rubra TaxID=43658 RepID=A0A4Q7EDM0_9GAMM|nr:hypothetical protein [Pseudoalteromonas rubra]RZM81186.1 hypothetical protein C3B51_09360 [Pseudoalteromonas rubra]
MIGKRWEVGSEYHFETTSSSEFYEWPTSSIFVASGRTPVLLLKELLGNQVLHYPDFFCWDVIKFWESHGIKTKSYDVSFTDGRFKVNFSSVPLRGVVLAVNFFGCDDSKSWQDFKAENDIFLIEDHTHSPVSDWVKNSNADYAFSSLRKTLPISDGCIFWSPNSRDLPNAELPAFNSAIKIEAMKLKTEYLEGGNVDKQVFLDLFSEGESCIVKSEPSGISKQAFTQVFRGYPVDYIVTRKRNFETFLKALSDVTLKHINLLHYSHAETPFGAIFTCETAAVRARLRRYLIDNKVYCPVHWPQEKGKVTDKSFALAERIITIPIDQRYSLQDVVLVAQIINRFFENE